MILFNKAMAGDGIFVLLWGTFSFIPPTVFFFFFFNCGDEPVLISAAGDTETSTIWGVQLGNQERPQTLRSQRNLMWFCLVEESMVKLNQGTTINPTLGNGARHPVSGSGVQFCPPED